ncbi:MAG: DNA-processing protein DprA [Verrucomicrobiales bacterium]
MDELEATLALNMLPGLGPVGIRRLLEQFGSAEAVLNAKHSDLERVDGVSVALADRIRSWEKHVDLGAELVRVERFGAKLVLPSDPTFPANLKTIHDPPALLYVWGELREKDRHAIAVVGSRRSTHYGNESAKKLSFQLASAGLCILSGLARGIDAAAHLGALAAQGRTIAVIGGGLSELYPPEHRGLAEKIAASGAVVSEFPMSRKPDRTTFPMRNRIVSGWSFGVLVVEAGQSSGALITANQAAEQGRTVFAVPGPIDRPTSFGCNRLIQNGAKLVMTSSDVFDELGLLFQEKQMPLFEEVQPKESIALPDGLGDLYHALGREERLIDELVEICQLPSGKVMSGLLQLEMRGLVKQLPGKRYVRLHHPAG